ncbi:MAG: exo-alpha-sialidase [Alphaproteobacteria bacterium]|nr:exo-alpha-sialidase [Alphaproteobacteria bacterium]
MSTTLIVGTKKGAAILSRGASGNDWQKRFELMGFEVTASARDEKGRYFLAVASPIFGAAIFWSDDLKNFTQLEAAPRYAEGDLGNEFHKRLTGASDPMGERQGPARTVDQIWTLHAANGALYAGVAEAGLFVSRDRGESWQPVRGLNEHPTRPEWEPGFGGLCAHTILTDAKNPDRMWVGISAAGLFRTDDGGKSWARKNDGIPQSVGQCVHALAHDPARADTLYRQDHRGVYLSQDGGDNWRAIEDGLPVADIGDGHIGCFGFPIAMDVPSNAVFIVPLEGFARAPREGRLTIFRTRTGGKSWEPLHGGLPEEFFAGVLRGAMSADQKGGVYFGTTSGTLYGSGDLGDKWSEIATGLPRIMSVRAYAA